MVALQLLLCSILLILLLSISKLFILAFMFTAHYVRLQVAVTQLIIE